MKEAQIEIQILHYLNLNFRHLKAFFWKNPTAGYFDPKQKRFRRHSNPYAINGVCDILGIINGRFIGLEVKSESGRVSESQKTFLQKATDAGAIVGVVRSIEDADKLIKGAL